MRRLLCGNCRKEIPWGEVRFQASWIRGSETLRTITRCLNCATEGIAEQEETS